ncbi:methyltransferase [Marssonina coronariae]|uniref:Methyltransferase n=1 Tax=Diplocarpon coronariae TaxID=2795749 RepID=A0A218Z1I7_9HELO|nr:methyltransferase [Marssonina coronariae]
MASPASSAAQHKQDSHLATDPVKLLVQQSYDKIADTYLEWTLSTPSPRLAYLQTLLSHLSSPSTSHILELGCGAGVPGTRFLSKSCGRVFGVDISLAQIERARKNVGSANADFVRSDMMALDFPDGRFDAVVGLYSILHMKKEEQVVLMERVCRWLKLGGVFVGNFALTGKEDTGPWLEGEKMFWGGWEEKDWLRNVEGAGFDVLQGDVVMDVEDGREVNFLWVVAKSRGGN